MKDEIVVNFESAAVDDPNQVRIRKLYGREQIGQLFEFEIHLVCSNPAGLDDQALLSGSACLVFVRDREEGEQDVELRRIYGIVCQVRDRCFSESRHREYLLRFVPRAWRTTLTATSDIFMDMTVPEIIEQKLKDAGLGSADYAFRLMAEYPKREFVVQYQESDLAFLSRLAEDVGLAMTFEHDDAKEADIVVFTDDNGSFEKIVPDTVSFSPRGDTTNVYELEATRRLITTDFKARDYNYRNPAMDILGEAKVEALGGGLLNEFGPHVKTPTEASRTATLRAEETGVEHFNLHGRGEIPTFRAGGTVTIEGHSYSGVGELLLVEVFHECVQPVFGMGGGDMEHAYTVDFRAIPLEVPYRPPRITPKPVVSGVVTGLVQHGSDTDFGPLDDHGRYHVSFMYDSVSDRAPGKASRPLRMAQPSAGPDRGMHIPLKPGTEVIITCINGDPDRPIIAGAVPNPQTYSPVNASNAEKSIIQTNKSTLTFDDRDARFRLTVGQKAAEENVLQIGAPANAEKGILLGTISNLTQISNAVFSNIGDDYSSFSNQKTDICSNSIVSAAGRAHPMAYWMKGEDLIKDIISWSKNAASAVDAYKELATIPAKDKKNKAEAKLAEAKSEDQKNPSGKSKKKVAEAELEAAKKDEALTKSEESFDVLLAEMVSGVIKDVVAAAEAGLEFVDKTIKPLHSMLSKASSGATSKLLATAAKEAQERMAQAVQDAKQRTEADVGKFAKDEDDEEKKDEKDTSMEAKAEGEAFNLLASSHTAAMIADDNILIHGIEHATFGSDKQAALVSGEWAHIKAITGIELAGGEDIRLTASNIIDIQSDKSIRLVAHDGEDDLSMPDAASLFLHSEKGTRLEAADNDIFIDAQGNGLFARGASTASIGAGGGSGFGMVATDSKVNFGGLSSVDKDSVSAKDSCTICIEDGKIKATGGGAKMELADKVKIEGDKIELG